MLNKGQSSYTLRQNLTLPLVIYMYFLQSLNISCFPSLHQSCREEMADIQAMFNATRPWLLLITTVNL